MINVDEDQQFQKTLKAIKGLEQAEAILTATGCTCANISEVSDTFKSGAGLIGYGHQMRHSLCPRSQVCRTAQMAVFWYTARHAD